MALTVAACAMFVTPCYGKNCGVVKSEESKIDTLSYALGANMGTSIKQQFADIALNVGVVIKGMDDALNGKMSQSHDEVVAMLREFFGNTLNERNQAYQEAKKADSTLVFNAFADAAECDKISYAFGNDIGCNVKKSNLPIQQYWLLAGLKEAWSGNSKLSPEEVTAYLNHYFTVVRPAEMALRSAAWLAEKEKEEGVRKTESGLLYKVVVVGDMSKAAKSDEQP